MSYHPNSEGKTCDDAHTILLEKVFDLEEYSRQKEKGKLLGILMQFTFHPHFLKNKYFINKNDQFMMEI